jgi:hypothetical protein
MSEADRTAPVGAAPSYSLGHWSQDPSNPTHSQRNEVHLITEAQFDTHLAAIATFRALTERKTYMLLLRNNHALEATLAAAENVEEVGGNFRRFDTSDLSLTLMGQLLNWLAAGRLYEKNMETYLRGQFGDTSDQFRRFTKATNRAFDGFAGYRFMYNLRDYAQHSGPPLSSLMVSRDGPRPRKLELQLHRSELLAAVGFTWKPHARRLLDAWPERFPVMPLVVEAMEGYRVIEDEVLRILIEACVVAVPSLREGIARVAAEPGQHPAIFRTTDRDDGVEDAVFSLQSFPNGADLDRLEAAASLPDPLAILRVPAPAKPARNPDMLEVDRRAAALFSVWFEHGGPSAELDAIVSSAVAEAGGASLVAGLVNLSAYLSAMVATLTGSTAQAVVGGFVQEPGSPPEQSAQPSPGG